MAVKSIAITTSGTFIVPSDFDSFISVEAIGAGGPGYGGTDSRYGQYTLSGGGGHMLNRLASQV